jgi:hypothetical protein
MCARLSKKKPSERLAGGLAGCTNMFTTIVFEITISAHG